ncbi:MAG: type I methionyl aminopeptidase, partial [Chloroflexota bacterium]
PEAIGAMRAAGWMLGQTLQILSAAAKPSMSGDELDIIARDTIRALGGEPAFLGFEKFPSTICLSRNDAIVHGLPTGQRLAAGDIIGIDCGVRLNGWNTDAAVTITIGQPSGVDTNLITATHKALVAGIQMVRPGVQLGEVQAAIQAVIEKLGYGLVRTLTGHGIGRSLHEAPGIPNYGTVGTGIRLEAGMVFCLEPMLTTGSGAVKTAADGWTIVASEGSHIRTAHQEHTILVTETGREVLSAQPGEII